MGDRITSIRSPQSPTGHISGPVSIVNTLHEHGQRVRAMARNVDRTRAVLPGGIDVVAGRLNIVAPG